LNVRESIKAGDSMIFHTVFARSDRAKGGLLGALLGLSLLTACAEPSTPKAHAADGKAKVTVALPVAASLTEFSEHTGHTEAPESVEIRARAGGHLLKASFEEGELVKRGDLLFVIDPRPYQNALKRSKAELRSIRADHQLAARDAERARQLQESGSIPEREWDRQHSLVEQLAARENVAEAAVAAAELDLEYAYVRSPIGGRIGRKLVTPGNLIGAGAATPLTTVVSVDPLYVYIDVEEARGLPLAKALDNTVVQVGFPGEVGYPHEAHLDFVDNHVDPSTGTRKVRAVVKNGDGALSHGLFARVKLPAGGTREGLLISDRAVATDQDRRFVWVVDAQGKVAYRGVKLGPMERGMRVVREGLSRDDRVIVRGLQRVRAGSEVVAELTEMSAVDGLSASAGATP
jgi:RND family efflux transporter MFP subunit